MTLISELIEVPERVQRGDFVLRLTEGVNRADETLRDYVVTPELVDCFDNALAFIRSSLDGNSSKASYLHGSFGSGKSHFMAVLHLILQGNTAARGVPELAPVITRHNEWVTGKKFLLVPYHMIGAHDMESGILGRYVEFVREVHPEAPIPGVYLGERLFDDARGLQETMGAEAFFAKLNEGRGGGGGKGWGKLGAGWDETRFEAAASSSPGSEERSQVISALIAKFFGSYDTQAGGHGEAFIDLDNGLSVLSRHARDLGYDGLILFLDELVLWLASHAADLRFVHQEGQKLAKLVEAQRADRPIPIISFVARQRDLRELIGDTVPGVELLSFGDALKHWEGRFHTITLEDRNLPAIAEKRVLKCRSAAARQELDAAFESAAKVREAIMNVLLTHDGDREMFRKLYPFSPALVQTLIAVSSVLQRERTALKVMVQLLVDQRDSLAVGDIVPVGDLFDVIAHGDEAFSQEMAIHFNNAKRLYHEKILPALESQHGRREDLEKLPPEDPRRRNFRNDDRLVKTLLLAALVPQVESLRGLNAERLSALNHGTIKSPIPGRESQEVLRRCRDWAAAGTGIRIGEEANPTISIQLSGVDTEAILEQARNMDNLGNRVRLVRDMLFAELGVDEPNQLILYHDFHWHNTKRSCNILFKNIRELPESSLAHDEDQWRLVIDFPFDEPGFGPRDDLSGLQEFSSKHPEGSKTLCWVPSFFSAQAQRDVGNLVVLNHILTGERFGQYTSHLSAQDRQSAKSLLENQRSVLRGRVKNHIEAAYGLEAVTQGSTDETHELELGERFVSLLPGFDLQPPVAANLGAAMEHLLDQALSHEFPSAPRFEAEVKKTILEKVYGVVREAIQSPDGRALVDKSLRPIVRGIANPLLLGELGHDATHFVLGTHWKSHFIRKAADTGGTFTVGQAREWIDEPRAMGLPKEAANLVILAFAEETDRTPYLHAAPYEADLGNLPDQCELREEALPPEEAWETAVARAGSIFGVAVSPLRKVSNVNDLILHVQERAGSVAASCEDYSKRLQERLLGLGGELDCPRVQTVTATVGLLGAIQNEKREGVVALLAELEPQTSEAAMGECVGKAATLSGVLQASGFQTLDALRGLSDGDERKAEADAVLQELVDALRQDEHVVELASSVQGAEAKALRILTKGATPPTPPLPAPDPIRDSVVVEEGEQSFDELDAARQHLDQLAEKMGDYEGIRVSMAWTITKDKPKP